MLSTYPLQIFFILSSREWDNWRACQVLAQLSWVLRSEASIRSTIRAQFIVTFHTTISKTANSHPPLILFVIHLDWSQPRSFQLYNPPRPTNRSPFAYLFRNQTPRFSETTNIQFRVCLLGNLSALLSTKYTFQPDKMPGHTARNKTELTEIILSS